MILLLLFGIGNFNLFLERDVISQRGNSLGRRSCLPFLRLCVLLDVLTDFMWKIKTIVRVVGDFHPLVVLWHLVEIHSWVVVGV